MSSLLALGAIKKLEKNLNKSLKANGENFRANRFLEPAFGVVTVYGSDYWGAAVYDHNLNQIGRSNYVNSYSNGNAMGGTISTTGSEGGNMYYSWSRTDSTASTSSSYYGGNTSRNSHLGHLGVDVAPNGTMVFKNGDHAGISARNVGTWLHNSTPDVAIFQQNSESYTGPRSHVGGYPILSGKESYFNNRFYGSDDFSTNGKYGMISYNELTKKLAIGESNGNQYVRFHVYSEVQPPSSFSVKNDFWSTTNINPTKKVITPLSDVRPIANSSEDNYRAVVVLCDNGDIVFHRMIPQWGAYTNKFIFNSGTNTYTFGGSGEQISVSWTTSYGMDQGNAYGARFQISNSGKYVLAYNAAYYYGSGFQATLIRVSDGKRLMTQHQDSNYGHNFVPWRDDQFAFSRNVNSDSGAMLYLYTINSPKDMVEINDKGAFIWNNSITQLIDTPGFYSTNYPFIVPIMTQNYHKFIQ